MTLENPFKTDAKYAFEAPNWCTHRINVAEITKIADKDVLDLSHVPVGYEVGDKLIFINVDNKEHISTICTINKVFGSNKYKFDQQLPVDGHKYVIMKFMANWDLEADQPVAAIPVSIEMIEADRKLTNPILRDMGMRSPGWYRWKLVTRHDGKRKVVSQMTISLKNFHGPEVSDVFEIDEQGNVTILFEPVDTPQGPDGEINLA